MIEVTQVRGGEGGQGVSLSPRAMELSADHPIQSLDPKRIPAEVEGDRTGDSSSTQRTLYIISVPLCSGEQTRGFSMSGAALQHRGSEAVTQSKWQSQDLGKDCPTSKASMCPTSPLRVAWRSLHGSHEFGREKNWSGPTSTGFFPRVKCPSWLPLWFLRSKDVDISWGAQCLPVESEITRCWVTEQPWGCMKAS